jgi:thiol-disulfide isomerase/thioredoxin
MFATLVVALALSAAQTQTSQAPTAQSVAAAAIAAAGGPAQCMTALQTFVPKRQQEVRPTTGITAALVRQVNDEKLVLAKSCLARFDAATIPPSQLPAFAELLIATGQQEEGRAALTRALAATLPPADRAAALATAINATLTEPKGDERNARLEKMLDELDTIPAAAFEQKFLAHSRLLGYYRADDIDAGIIKHATWIAGAAKSFTPEQRKTFGSRMVSAQGDMAEALAGQGMNDEALALLKKTQAEWADIPHAAEDLAPVIARYSLVGTKAPAISAPRWLNAPPGTKDMAMDGAVTLLEFTAHWCGPCRESYPGVNRLRQQFGPKGFRVVMVTRYWGYFSQERTLAPEEELKRDIGYFQDHHLDVPVAVADQVTGVTGRDANDLNYKVGGIPQIHIIDKQGKIRLIMVGYDDANEPKLAAFIAKLVDEPTQSPAAGGVVHVPLEYRAAGDGPKPNFSPKGTQVTLTPVSATATLPPGAMRPAKSGSIQVGPDKKAWIPVLVTADAAHPQDLCNLFLDRNRNGSFTDDGPAITAAPSQNDKTKAWWTSFNKIELFIPYPPSQGPWPTSGTVATPEPYLVNFWAVRDGDNPPDILRYSVGSWRYGKATVDGINVLVAAMDGDNDAVFGKADYWSVLEASAPEAEKNVLTHTEAKGTSRLMFAKDGARERVLEFRSFSPDGRSIDFAIVDRPVTKLADRAGDDTVKDERPRPRTTAPFSWGHDFNAALAQAKAAGKKVFVDFEATWCGPCKTMDEWIWTDAEVAAQLGAGYVGVKLDGDIEKALVKRYTVKGYPTMLVLDAAGTESTRAIGYLSSKEVLALLGAKR